MFHILSKTIASETGVEIRGIFANVSWPTIQKPAFKPEIELLRRLSKKEKAYVRKYINREDADFKPLTQAIKNGDWFAKSFKKRDWAPKVYALYYQKKISWEQMLTTLIFQSAREQFEDQNGINLSIGKWPNAEELDLPDGLILNTVKSEKTYLNIKFNHPLRKNKFMYGFQKALHEISEQLTVFNYRSFTQQLIIPSYSMMKAFLKNTEHPVALKPVLGLSTEEDIQLNLLENNRDFFIRFPGITNMTRAHNAYFGEYLPTIHDFYHAYCFSHTPQQHRLAVFLIAEILKSFDDWSEKHTQKVLLEVNLPEKLIQLKALSSEQLSYFHRAVFELIDLDLGAYGSIRGIVPARILVLGEALKETLGDLDQGSLNNAALALITHMVIFRREWIKNLKIDPLSIGWGKKDKELFENIFKKFEQSLSEQK